MIVTRRQQQEELRRPTGGTASPAAGSVGPPAAGISGVAQQGQWVSETAVVAATVTQTGRQFRVAPDGSDAGYNEGVRQGRTIVTGVEAMGYGYGNDFRNSSSYRNATKDYNSRYGDRELYRRYFQMAFQNGYAGRLERLLIRPYRQKR